MSLKDAIREAAGERDKKEITQNVTEAVLQPDNSAVNTESIENVKAASSKAVYTASNKALNTASSKAAKVTPKATTTINLPIEVDEEIELAALTVRVPRNSRIHWLVSAKKQNTTLTAAIIEALNERFGVAED